MQKKILLTVAVICVIVTFANAQIKKGTFITGIQFGLGNSDFKADSVNNSPAVNQKSSNFSISPSFGKAIKENLIIGVDIIYMRNKNQYSSSFAIIGNYYGAGFFVRKYKGLGKGFYLFGQGRAGGTYFTGRYDSDPPVASNKTKGYSIKIACYPGVAYTINKKFQVEAGFNNIAFLQFDHSKDGPETNLVPQYKTNTFSLGTSLSDLSGLTIGFRMLFN